MPVSREAAFRGRRVAISADGLQQCENGGAEGLFRVSCSGFLTCCRSAEEQPWLSGAGDGQPFQHV